MAGGDDGRARAWILRLDDALPIPSWLTGVIAVALVYAGHGVLRGLGEASDPNLALYDSGLALVMALQTAYLVAVVPPAVRETRRQLRRLEGVLVPGPARLAAEDRLLTHHPRRQLLGALALAPLLMVALQELAIGRWSAYLRDGFAAAGLWTSAWAAVYWATLGTAAVVLVGNAMVFRRLGIDGVTIDLFRRMAHAPFVRVGLLLSLLVAGIPALLTFGNAIGGLMGNLNPVNRVVPVLLLSSYLGIASLGLLLPMLGIRRGIRREKEAAMAELEKRLEPHDEVIDRLDTEGPGVARESLDVLALRDRIDDVSEWPLTAPNLVRFGLYLLLPLASWVAAAMVERGLDRVME